MLSNLINEMEIALNNAIKVEDRLNPDGETFEYRRSVIQFKGTQVEFLFKRRPGSGLNADGLADPSKGPKYTLTIFVPSTKKVIDPETKQDIEPKMGAWIKNLFVDSICPQAEFLVTILQSIEVNNHDQVVADRAKDVASMAVEAKQEIWAKKLSKTSFSEEAKKIFLDHAVSIANEWKISKRAEYFINSVVKFETNIIAEDLEACGAVEFNNPGFKSNYTLVDVMYNVIAQLLDCEIENVYGDKLIPEYAIKGKFLDTNPELDSHMPTYVRATRAFLRELWADCYEKSTTFAFVLNGLAKYYAYVTFESLELRIARNRKRIKEVKRANAFGRPNHSAPTQKNHPNTKPTTPKQSYSKKEKPAAEAEVKEYSDNSSNFGCIGDLIDEQLKKQK